MLFLANEEAGQGLVEYGMILVLIAIVAMGILTILGPQLMTKYKTVVEALL